MSLDRLSLSTVPIIPFFNDRQLAGSTGFIWKRRERFYLITNWHVVSALDFFTKAHLSEGGARPNKLRCHFLIRVGEYERESVDVPIRDEDDQPLWLIHSAQEMRAIDLVALPLDYEGLRARVTLLPLNELAPGKIAIMIGMDVFILGYPFGSKPPAFPVWKRGSIASEPDLVRLTTGYYLDFLSPFPPRAERCALAAEELMGTCDGGSSAWASAWNSSIHTSLAAQRTKRL